MGAVERYYLAVSYVKGLIVPAHGEIIGCLGRGSGGADSFLHECDKVHSIYMCEP